MKMKKRMTQLLYDVNFASNCASSSFIRVLCDKAQVV